MLHNAWVHRPRRRLFPGALGFSVIELLVVIGVLGIAFVVVMPNFLALLRQSRLTAAANQVANLVQQTRLRAIRDGQEYTVGVDGVEIVGRGVLDSGLAADGQTRIELEDEGLAVFPPGPPGESSPAVCPAGYDGDSVTYNSLGVASGTLAICVSDGFGNVLQVALDFPNGQPKVKKYLPDGVPPDPPGFYENISAATADTTWVWY